MKLLITRDKPWLELQTHLDPAFQPVYCAFISVEFVRISELPECEWIFFVSPHSVSAVLQQFSKESLQSFKLAALGLGTANQLSISGLSCQFTGQGTDTRNIARQFFKIAGENHVFFPVGDRSLRNIQSQLPHVVEKTVYLTKEKPAIAPDFDAVFFTSPSNVKGFAASNTFPPAEKVMAIGPSTSGALNNKCGMLGSLDTRAMASDLKAYFLP